MTEEAVELVPEIAPDSVPFSHGDWKDHARNLVEQEQFSELATYLNELYPADIADFLVELGAEKADVVLLGLDHKRQGEILLQLEEHERAKFLDGLSAKQIASIIKQQQSDEIRVLIADLPKETISEVLSRIPLEERILVTELLSYPDNTAGSLMAKEFVAVRETDTVQKAIQTIRKISKETDDIYTVYVLDEDGKFKGHIKLQKLILTSPRVKVKRLVEGDIFPIPVDMDQEEVANFFTRYDFISAPVVDSRGLMLGRITVDDVLAVVREEASEDILRLGGVSADETLSTPLHVASFRRVLWLAINLVTAFMAASVVKLFEGTIERMVLLASLMPIVAGMGGNGATQTMAVIIRGIALGDLEPGRAGRAILREATIGLVNGLAMGAITGIVVWLFTSDAKTAAVVAPIITLALIFNMTIAAFSGAIIPLVLRRFGIDPAIASSIFVTTFTDVGGFFSLLGLAWLALRYFVPA
ncbi:MAG: magnesium transporter [Spirochaetia bacterium]|nr:magnesium transporter [Spirochaetia bacterium]